MLEQRLKRLSPRERQVFDGLCARKEPKQIAEYLGVSPVTIKSYIAGIRTVLRIGPGRVALRVWLHQHGWPQDDGMDR